LLGHFGVAGQGLEIDIALGLLGVVALVAALSQDGLDAVPGRCVWGGGSVEAAQTQTKEGKSRRDKGGREADMGGLLKYAA